MSEGAVGWRVRILGTLLILALGLAAAEGLGRVAYAFLDRAREGRLPPKTFLKPYEMLDPQQPGLYRPTPGYEMTLAEALAMVREERLVVQEQVLERGAARLGVRDDEVIFRINSDGFKGPELDRSGARPRVLAVGDSCTFGALIDRYTWPRSAERELARLGVDAEVVNAGVNGYSPAHALARFDELRALEPRVVVIYIGWNALFGERAAVEGNWFAIQRLAYTLRMLVWMRGKTPQEIALAFYEAPKRPDANAPELPRLAAHRPAFLADVERLVRQFGEAGAQVVLTTLPGLYLQDEAPTPRALEIGHLPEFTANPYVVGALAAGYNAGLRAIAAETGATLVDLDAWSRTALVPRDAWFTDSVHLTEEGQERIGVEIARSVAPLLAAPED